MTTESFRDGDVRRISRLDLTFRPMRWAFAEQRRAEIDAYFAEQSARRSLWNGRVLLARDARMSGDVFSADYFETDYASFLAWRAWETPDDGVRNCFGMGAVRSIDGAFLLGEMADHTAGAGMVYFPAGTPDPSDLAGDQIDLDASVVRETEEEIGLSPADYAAEPGWTATRAGTEMAFMRVLHAPVDAAGLKRRVEHWLAAQARPEFSTIHIVHGMRDLPERTIAPVRAFLALALSG